MIPGLTIQKNYLAEQQHNSTLLHIEKLTGSTIYRFGRTDAYEGGKYAGEITHWQKDLFQGITFNSLSIRIYHEKQGIGYHIDNAKSGDTITILNLLSDAQMNLRLKGKQSDTQITLEPGDLLQLSGDARWLYEHEILPVKKLRYSIVLRNC